ncbi:G-protein-signaling modulator 2-like [Limulus polyphemus]|uniref:G-protein-signaling modulator 2-like n=1 Tax=Limulus polyphemus TaxID=6850 RepID=A0ABM1S490_LIMPO|nr:G-protein-signaling modulator 2-like [Limulus polyphemus]XP_022238445.1 G-protein-signaling modulator 2-like [Limulus polyphemus]
MDFTTCLELALEGERLCKSGNFNGGIAYFNAAIQVGADDPKTLSAIYSQLGNAHFYLGEYGKALEYHKLDLTIARAMGDQIGEAKASGNLGNTLKVMGKFEEAVICCKRHLEISRDLKDKVGEGRALYNLGNVYHVKGKHMARLGQQDPGEFPEEVKVCLEKAVEYYEQNLTLVKDIGDKSAQGRACGNLGNTYYLLGDFPKTISYHQERLSIAREFGDKAAERRAHSNLGNAHIFLGEFETAAEHYKKTLSLAEELGDRAVEAQACYSLGNTYTLLHDYLTAIKYHLRHLQIAKELKDRVGEGRACWSLGNAYSAIGDNEKALQYATKHLYIAEQIGDKVGLTSANMGVVELQNILGAQNHIEDKITHGSMENTPAKIRVRRVSMERMDLLKLTPESNISKENKENMTSSKESPKKVLISGDNRRSSKDSPKSGDSQNSSSKEKIGGSSFDQDSFFELLSQFQSKRMDDQRCSRALLERNTANGTSSTTLHHASLQLDNEDQENQSMREDLFDLIAGMQSQRMDEQRASLPTLPGLGISKSLRTRNQFISNNSLEQHRHLLHRMSVDTAALPDDDFFDTLMRCQSTRIEDQRSSMPNIASQPARALSSKIVPTSQHAPTVPDDDFFSLILRFQAGRIDDQRSALPSKSTSELDTINKNSNRTCSSSRSRNLLKSSLGHGLRGSYSLKSKKY